MKINASLIQVSNSLLMLAKTPELFWLVFLLL